MSLKQVVTCLRHGACEGPHCLRGHTNVPLSALGRRQVMEAAENMAIPDVIFSSPLVRCLESAQFLADKWQIELRVLDNLTEMNFGEWDGVPLDQLYAEIPEQLSAFWRDPEGVTPPGGETLANFRLRISDAWNTITAALSTRPLVLTHGGVIKIWMSQQFGMTRLPPEYLSSIKLDYAGMARFRVSQENDDPGKISKSDNIWTVLDYFGPVCHS